MKWVAISYSRVSSLPRDQNCISCKPSALQEDSLPLNHQGSANTRFSSVTPSCSTLSDVIYCSPPGCPSSPPEPAQTHVHRIGDAIQPSHPLSSPSPRAFHLSQHQEKTHSDHVKKKKKTLLLITILLIK